MRAFLKRIDELLLGRLKDQSLKLLEKEFEGCESLLDVGCGSHSPVGLFSRRPRRSVGIDVFQPAVEQSTAARIHDEYVLMDVMDLGRRFSDRSFDCVIAIDVIEHLTKNDGYELIWMMERIARRKVVIFTPNGFLKQGEYEGNRYQVHRSGWEVNEMRGLGYRVTGINGWKPLRGECADAKWWPSSFWFRVSLISQLFTTQNPRHAFAIFCVKELQPSSWPSPGRGGGQRRMTGPADPAEIEAVLEGVP